MRATRFLLIGFCLGLIVVSGCKPAGEENPQPAQSNNTSGQPTESAVASASPDTTPTGQGSGGNYASQSQAMLVGGTSPYGYGTSRVVYEHNFDFIFSGGSSSMQMNTSVKGFVPMDVTKAGEGSPVCDWGDYKPNHLLYSGKGKVDVTGSAFMGDDDDSCSCTISNKIDVTADAVTTFEALIDNGKCYERTTINIRLDETWYTKPNWKCTCTDPDDAPEAEQQFNAMPSIPNPDLKEKTLQFNYYCDGSYIDEDLADPSGIGTGTYMWTWYSGKNETANPPTNPGGLAQDPSQEPIPDCSEGRWGPSLDSIMPAITWYNQK